MDPTEGARPAADSVAGAAARRRRGHVARRRFNPWAVGVVVAALGAGGLFALSAQTSGGHLLRADRADQVALVRNAAARKDATERRVAELRKENAALARSFAPVDSLVGDLQRQVDALSPQAGLAPVRGETVEVVLDDAPRGTPVPKDIPADYLVVHQQDVQAVVNALWRGGAEAMMLMDQRVISTSAVRCVGNTLLLQGRVYSPPYRIRAIGDPAALQKALDSSPEVAVYRQFVDLVNLGYKVRTVGEQTFPAFDLASLAHAVPLDGAGTGVVDAASAGAGTASRTAGGTVSGAVPAGAAPSAPATSASPGG